ncbi:TPA: sugar transferase [Campylobacter jejuni]
MSFSWESFRFFDFDFIIDENVKIHNIFDENVKRPKYDEYNKNFENNKQAGVIGFLLLPLNENMEKVDFIEKDVVLSKEYDFTYLCNYLKDFKIIIEQYNQRQDLIKLAPLQNQIKEKDNIISVLNQEKITLQNELNSLPIQKQNLEIKNLEQDLKNKELQSFILKKELGNKFIKNININYIDKNSAKTRIHNHLCYKLGQALIENSKSILGYVRMPFVLSYIKDKHKFEQKAYEEKIKENPNLALPPLEAYPDYKEALKEKECFTYKLGEAFIKASKNWYGVGYIKFIFKDVPRLKREFEKR